MTPKPYAEMTDAEFRRAVKDEHGFDPLPPDRPKAPVKQYTGTDDLIAQFKQHGRVKNADLVRQLALAVAQSDFAQSDSGSEVIIRREIVHIAAIKLFGAVQWSRAQAEAQKGKKRAGSHHSQWQQMANGFWANNGSLTKNGAAKLIARKLGGTTRADTIRRVIVKPK
jgi:hypothetical protein